MIAEDIEHLRLLKAALAEEIRGVRRLIEQIAETVIADEDFALANVDQLQAFDLAIQRADETADMLERLSGGACATSAIDKVRLGCVQDRLRAALRSAA
jgi:hypothetical protein